jgi:hypothetical protein
MGSSLPKMMASVSFRMSDSEAVDRLGSHQVEIHVVRAEISKCVLKSR